MAKCDVCGNEYDKSFEVTYRGRGYTFDSFECAIHALAPICAHCGCRVIGHGVEAGDRIFCCASCAGQLGIEGVRDRT
jgi:Rieske Fe-S protein